VIDRFIEWAAVAIELLAVAVIVGAVAVMAMTRGTARFLFKLENQSAYENYNHQLGKALLLGLELLVAADVVRTVALEATLTNVAVLGLLVGVRTFLSWSMTVEIEGRWPWHATAEATRALHPRGNRDDRGILCTRLRDADRPG
jgi:uncharacterized membrane protein